MTLKVGTPVLFFHSMGEKFVIGKVTDLPSEHLDVIVVVDPHGHVFATTQYLEMSEEEWNLHTFVAEVMKS